VVGDDLAFFALSVQRTKVQKMQDRPLAGRGCWLAGGNAPALCAETGADDHDLVQKLVEGSDVGGAFFSRDAAEGLDGLRDVRQTIVALGYLFGDGGTTAVVAVPVCGAQDLSLVIVCVCTAH